MKTPLFPSELIEGVSFLSLEINPFFQFLLSSVPSPPSFTNFCVLFPPPLSFSLDPSSSPPPLASSLIVSSVSVPAKACMEKSEGGGEEGELRGGVRVWETERDYSDNAFGVDLGLSYGLAAKKGPCHGPTVYMVCFTHL